MIYGDSNGYIIWHCQNDSALKELVLKVYEEWENNLKYCDKMIELLVMEFILILMRSHEDEAVFSTSYINNSDENFRSLLIIIANAITRQLRCQNLLLLSITVNARLSVFSKKIPGKAFLNF